MKHVYLYITIFLTVSLIGCKESKEERITRLVNEWSEKEIRFPTHSVFTQFGKDTVCSFNEKGRYRIVTYVDSMGCISCKLKLPEWKKLISITDSLSEQPIPYLFFFHPKDLKELRYILKRDAFDYPVCIDLKDEFNSLNHFPSEYTFQTFLLDEENKVVAMGNPIHNPKVKELYLSVLTGKKQEDKASLVNTTVSIDKRKADFGEFSWKEPQTATFELKNTGKNLFVIHDITTSCGCIKVDYNKEPVKQGKTVTLKVTYTAEHAEQINKTISLYCNTVKSPIELQVKGNAR